MGGRRQKVGGVPHGSSHGQSSMEYLMIAGLAMVFLALIMVIAYSQSASFSQEVTASQIQKVSSQIIDAANAVYYAGPPAKRTLTLYFPEHISNVTLGNQSLTFYFQASGGGAEHSLTAQTNMTGNIRPFAGTHVITVEATTNIVNITDG